MIAQKGNELRVSAIPDDGTWPTATTQWEKRNVAAFIPAWDPAACIQCGQCSIICPHAAIRMKVYDEDKLAGAPATFKSADSKTPKMKALGAKVTVQVAPEDCMGCELCVVQCPMAAKLKTSYGNRLLAVEWETGKALDFPVNIYIQGIDTIGILHRIADIVSEELNVNIRKIFIETKDGLFEGHIQMFVHDVDDVKTIISKLQKIEEMKVVTRVEKFEDKV
jgi:ferredoxin